jgi:hypothetical protein
MQYVGVFGMKILTGKRDMSANLPRADFAAAGLAKQRSPDGEKVKCFLRDIHAVPGTHGMRQRCTHQVVRVANESCAPQKLGLGVVQPAGGAAHAEAARQHVGKRAIHIHVILWAAAHKHVSR